MPIRVWGDGQVMIDGEVIPVQLETWNAQVAQSVVADEQAPFTLDDMNRLLDRLKANSATFPWMQVVSYPQEEDTRASSVEEEAPQPFLNPVNEVHPYDH